RRSPPPGSSRTSPPPISSSPPRRSRRSTPWTAPTAASARTPRTPGSEPAAGARADRPAPLGGGAGQPVSHGAGRSVWHGAGWSRPEQRGSALREQGGDLRMAGDVPLEQLLPERGGADQGMRREALPGRLPRTGHGSLEDLPLGGPQGGHHPQPAQLHRGHRL